MSEFWVGIFAVREDGLREAPPLVKKFFRDRKSKCFKETVFGNKCLVLFNLPIHYEWELWEEGNEKAGAVSKWLKGEGKDIGFVIDYYFMD